jgi:hypothetical protein
VQNRIRELALSIEKKPMFVQDSKNN